MKMGEKIKAARKARGWSGSRLAREAGVPQSTVDRIERGETLISRALPKICEVLELTPDDVVLLPSAAPPRNGVSQRSSDRIERYFPIYGAAEGGGGVIIVNEAVEHRPIPAYLASVKDAYGVYIVGESMVPRFKPGEIAEVNPHLPYRRDCDVILYREQPDEAATIKHLVRWTETEWVVEQHNPPKTLKLSRREWVRCHVVVGSQFS